MRINELKQLRVGWVDGKGTPLLQSGLDWLSDSFDSYYPSDIKLPYLFQTPEGHVLAKWPIKPWALSLEIDLTSIHADWHALNLDNEIQKTQSFDLSKPDDWCRLLNQIRTLGEGDRMTQPVLHEV